MSEFFYHASNVGGLTELLPLSTMHGSGGKVCYVTPIRAYALFYLRDMEIDHVSCGVSESGVAIYHEQFEGQLEALYRGRSGYIYTCKGHGSFISAHANGVWASPRPIAVSAEEYIDDVYAEILKTEQLKSVKIIRFATLSGGEKDEITAGIRHDILHFDCLNDSDSAKSRFYIKHFPQAWEDALRETEIKT